MTCFKIGKQRKNTVALILIVLIVISFGGYFWTLGTISPGFEGAKCYFYGVYLGGTNWQKYTGGNQLHRYQDAKYPIASYTQGQTKLYWASYATPNDAGIGWRNDASNCEWPNLKIHVESNIKLEDITRQGDPLGWNPNNPLEGRRIEYWSKSATKIAEYANVVKYRYNVTKESFILVPAEFWVGFSLVPSQQYAQTGSGWREGEWQGLTCWFMLDFAIWDNAYRDLWLDDPKENVFTTEYGGVIKSQQKTADYRGGFPIAGWIQGWEKAGWTSAGSGESPVWYDLKGKKTGTYTDEQLHELKDQLMAKCMFSPGLVGTTLCLYDAPSATFSYVAPYPSSSFSNNNSLSNAVKSPDSRMQKTMYFPINIENFGTLAKGDVLSGWTVYYPSAYFRVRMIYGVYGTFTYLWTEEVTKTMAEGGLEYPKEFERQGTTVVTTPGLLTGIAEWLSSPFNQLWVLLGIFVIILIALAATGTLPAIIYALSGRRKK